MHTDSLHELTPSVKLFCLTSSHKIEVPPAHLCFIFSVELALYTAATLDWLLPALPGLTVPYSAA